MQVTCPGCQSRFKLPEGVQPGARLRCSVCGTIFALPGDAEAQEQAVPAPEGASAAPAPQGASQASSPAASPDRPAGAASLPEGPEAPEASGSAEAPESPEGRRSGWAVWLLVLALAAGACLCIAWQVSEDFREAVMGRPQTGQKQPAGSPAEASSAAGPSTAAPAPAQARGGVA
ncbi:MAG: zinc-ribbon domain-containing protein, partial [Desulfovibrio sp.]|nr:zinc-ribbon domain-containing protein [Desulfovibrio sp.]